MFPNFTQCNKPVNPGVQAVLDTCVVPFRATTVYFGEHGALLFKWSSSLESTRKWGMKGRQEGSAVAPVQAAWATDNPEPHAICFMSVNTQGQNVSVCCPVGFLCSAPVMQNWICTLRWIFYKCDPNDRLLLIPIWKDTPPVWPWVH